MRNNATNITVSNLVILFFLLGLAAASRLRSSQTIVASRREGTHPGWAISEFEVHPSTSLKFTIHLKQHGLDELENVFHAVSDPSNPRYGWSISYQESHTCSYPLIINFVFPCQPHRNCSQANFSLKPIWMQWFVPWRACFSA